MIRMGLKNEQERYRKIEGGLDIPPNRVFVPEYELGPDYRTIFKGWLSHQKKSRRLEYGKPKTTIQKFIV